jgi:multidrug efflux system membrane fusion protein
VKRVLPAFILILVTCAAVAFVYKERLFPKPLGEAAGEEGSRAGGGGGGRRSRRGGGDPNRPVVVLAVAAKTADVPVYLNGVGTVQAYNSAAVHAQVSGRLIEVDFAEGQDVKQGDVLARIDPATYKAAYDQAVAKKAMDEATLANAKRDLQRYESLQKSAYASEQQAETQRTLVAQTEAQIRQDQAAIDSAKTNLDLTTIRAPFDGRAGIRELDIGNLVTSGDAGSIVVIAQLQPVSVLFTLPETYVGDLVAAKAAGQVALTASVNGKTVGEGALEVIDNRIDQSTGTVRLKGTFPNDKLSLWPGQFVNIRLHLRTLPGATVAPSAAVQQGASGRFVYVPQPDDTVKLTTVEVTQEAEDLAVIAKGIKPGDRVVTSGFANLQDGAKVTPTFQDWPSAAPEAAADAATDEAAPAPPAATGEPRRRRRDRSGAKSGEKDHRSAVAQGQAGPAQ